MFKRLRGCLFDSVGSRDCPYGTVGSRVCMSSTWCWVKLLLSSGVRSSGYLSGSVISRACLFKCVWSSG